MLIIALRLQIFTAFFVDHGTAQDFQIPGEVLQQVLNVTKDEYYQKCAQRNLQCNIAVGRDTLETVEQKSGEKIIELLINRIRQPSPFTELMWHKAFDRHCNRDIYFQTIFDFGMRSLVQCIPELAANKERLEDFKRQYFAVYCDRLEKA